MRWRIRDLFNKKPSVPVSDYVSVTITEVGRYTLTPLEEILEKEAFKVCDHSEKIPYAENTGFRYPLFRAFAISTFDQFVDMDERVEC